MALSRSSTACWAPRPTFFAIFFTLRLFLAAAMPAAVMAAVAASPPATIMVVRVVCLFIPCAPPFFVCAARRFSRVPVIVFPAKCSPIRLFLTPRLC